MTVEHSPLMPVVPESAYVTERAARLRAEAALEACLAELADRRPGMRRRAADAIYRAWVAWAARVSEGGSVRPPSVEAGEAVQQRAASPAEVQR